jgi:hypothetical protein
MSETPPVYPENLDEGITNLQAYYKEAVHSRYISGGYKEHRVILVDVLQQLSKLTTTVNSLDFARSLRGDQVIDPTSPYAQDLAEMVFELIRLANSPYGTVDLAAALRHQETVHDEWEAARKAKADAKHKEWYDAQPKYHAEDSGRNPLRPDGLYGKAAQAADGDWYSSH